MGVHQIDWTWTSQVETTQSSHDTQSERLNSDGVDHDGRISGSSLFSLVTILPGCRHVFMEVIWKLIHGVLSHTGILRCSKSEVQAAAFRNMKTVKMKL